MTTTPQKLPLYAVAIGALLNFSEAIATAQTTSPVILCHPKSLVVRENKKATFDVTAVNPPPPYVNPQLMYQWERRGPGGTNFVSIAGATNTSYVIAHVSTNDVAHYRVQVASTNGTSISEPAHLVVYTHHSPYTAYGSPVVSSGGSGTTCPGPYVGYVNYPLGWRPREYFIHQQHRAYDDTGRTDTKVEVDGFTDDFFCALTVVPETHSGAPAPEDTNYNFTIYFPTNVPTYSYPLTLEAFKP